MKHEPVCVVLLRHLSRNRTSKIYKSQVRHVFHNTPLYYHHKIDLSACGQILVAPKVPQGVYNRCPPRNLVATKLDLPAHTEAFLSPSSLPLQDLKMQMTLDNTIGAAYLGSAAASMYVLPYFPVRALILIRLDSLESHLCRHTCTT